MNQLQVTDLCKSFGDHEIVSHISFTLVRGERVALVGRNGCGKTTLFKLLTGELAADAGEVTIPPGARMEVLDQIPLYPAAFSVEQVMRTGFAPLQEMERELSLLRTQMEKDSSRALSLITSAADSGLDEAIKKLVMIYRNGEVVGVLRYVTSTRLVDRQILLIGLFALAVFLVILGVLLLTSGYYIRSILKPVDEITQKAKKIANGSYGVQIQKKYNDEIGDLADTINEMSNKISQNEKMQADFISSLSHELRTPLTAINGWSETLLDSDDLDAETRRGVKIISGEAKRLTEMVVDLLDFTRLQDDRLTLNVEMTDIRAEFEDTVYMYSSRLSQEGIRLECLDNEDEIPEIPCDPKRLRQVFLNILDNAAKHGGEGKRIEANMKFEEDFVVVRIRDYGPGIPEDELPLVKKKFYKGNSKVRGTGIGLAVCDDIVAMHGGTLELENASGGGTLVTLRLPSSQ